MNWTWPKRVALGMGALVLAGGVVGCSAKQVDIAATGATYVHGTSNLWRFCDGTTLIYFSNYGSTVNDEYEFVIYDGCKVEGAVPDQSGVQNLPDEE